jgi:hypothetical protein
MRVSTGLATLGANAPTGSVGKESADEPAAKRKGREPFGFRNGFQNVALMGSAGAVELRLLTYLSPGLPLALFGAVADHLRRCPELGGRRIALASEERVSGPEQSSVDRSEVPFSRGEAAAGFLCAPTYLRLREREHPPAELLGIAPVFADERAHGKPVYFCDVIVSRSSPARSFWDLEGGACAYNDPSSLSGHGGLAARLGSPKTIGTFFGRTIRSGSHPASVRLVEEDYDAGRLPQPLPGR